MAVPMELASPAFNHTRDCCARDRFLQVQNVRRFLLLYIDVYLYFTHEHTSFTSDPHRADPSDPTHGTWFPFHYSPGPNGPYYSLNSWENGKNCCRYLLQHKVPEVQQAIEGYHKYQQLTEQYAQQVVEQTRAQLSIGVKKKPRPNPERSPRKSASPKSRKSST